MRLLSCTIGITALLSSCLVFALSQPDLGVARINPSLIDQHPPGTPWLVALGGELYLDDSDDFLGEMQETANLAIKSFSSDGVFLLLPGGSQPLIEQLKETDGRVVSTDGGLNAAFSIPSAQHALQLNIGVEGRGAGTFVYDDEDEQTLQLAAIGVLLGAIDLKSRMQVSMKVISDIGISYARPFSSESQLQWGATLKIQNIVLIERTRSITEYEESKLFDSNRDSKDYTTANLDLGLSWQGDNYRLSAAAFNLKPGNYQGPQGGRYPMRPKLQLGAEYLPDWGGLKLLLDASPDQGFGVMEDLQVAKLTSNYQLMQRLNLALGYNHIHKGDYDDFVSAAVRYQFEAIYIQFHGRIADRGLGGGLAIQMMF